MTFSFVPLVAGHLTVRRYVRLPRHRLSRMTAPRRAPNPSGEWSAARPEPRLEHALQLGPGCNSELGKGAVEVRADGAVGEIKHLRDLAVAHPVGGHLSDLQFLR